VAERHGLGYVGATLFRDIRRWTNSESADSGMQKVRTEAATSVDSIKLQSNVATSDTWLLPQSGQAQLGLKIERRLSA